MSVPYRFVREVINSHERHQRKLDNEAKALKRKRPEEEEDEEEERYFRKLKEAIRAKITAKVHPGNVPAS